MGMTIGFTGSRKGMTAKQEMLFKELLDSGKYNRLIHGDCIGADAQAHKIALEYGLEVEIYPPIKDKLRAFCKGGKLEKEPKGYLARNRDIVHDCDVVVGTPPTSVDIGKGGTWYTIRYADKIEHSFIILLP